ncbi:MAG: hypothetical protein KDD11_12765 [Acidobacteria bacterium]|nr:hypothetical protein [Acidobacteriota bacterium]
MTHPETNSTPGFRQIVAAELALYRDHKPRSRNIWLALILGQVALLASAGIFLGLTIQIDHGPPRFLFSTASDLGLENAPAAALVGCLMAAIWGFLEPLSRTKSKRYRWSLPADRRTLDLAAWVAGATVTIAVSTLALVTTVLVAGLAGNLYQLAVFPPEEWLALWSVPLLPYAWSSLLGVRGGRSKTVLIPMVLALLVVLPLLAGHNALDYQRVGEALSYGPLSLHNALLGGLVTLSEGTRDLDASQWPAAFALWLALAMTAFFVLTRPRH